MSMVARAKTVDARSAPLDGWRRALLDSLRVSASTIAGQILGAATSLLLRGLLDPARMGVWQGLKLLLSYGNYTNLGITKAAAQEISVATGSGKLAEARPGLNLAFSFSTLSSALFALSLLVVAGWTAARGDLSSPLTRAWIVGLVAVAALAMLQRYVTFHVTILRARQEFALTSWLTLLEAVLTLAVSAAAVWLWGVYGLYVATLIVLLGSWAFLQGRSERLRFAWDWVEIRRMIGVGCPLLAAGVASSLFRSLDKIMILAYMEQGEHHLGCYSLALMLTAQLYGLANMASAVMAPRYAAIFGRTGDVRDAARLAARASELQAAALVLPAALAMIAAPPVLAWLLPAYREGLTPLFWLVPGTLAVSLALPASQYLVAVNRGRSVLAALLAAIGVAAVGNHFALTLHTGLAGVAIATLVADIFYLLVLVAISLWPHLDTYARLCYAASVGLAILGTAALAAWLHTS
jgi:O-antigen/teichoic acid export membrane protein